MYQLDPQLQSWLTQFQSALQHEKNNFLINELLIHLFEKLILLQKSALKELYPLHAMRATTKMEIYRRLNYVRDFIDSSYSENIELKDCAKVALMSPEYLLRQFKVVFGITPYQYTMQKRLTAASLLIAKEEISITQICKQVGYVDIASFSKLFKKTYGITPSQYSKQLVN